ncbi:pre-rRNA-processing protein Esf1p [Trichomonascus vanleenenianus]|uniref:pre-rRNA-processing protein ESF1 n=1 Tax=Trichomonascus vanleenenianus TaxID=2268995 RepID=UPI003EC9F649
MGKKAVTQDSRFAGIHSDPRFNLPRKKQVKGPVDERFKSVIEKDDRFKSKVVRDKYGRKVKEDKTERELKKYAFDESESEESEEEVEKVEEEEEEESGSESESESGSEDEVKNFDPARGEGVSDLSESSDESSSSSEEESEDEYEEEEEVKLPSQEEAIPRGDETRRFAAMYMDWDNIRSIDLMATFGSFVPPKGRLISVKIYPSEYGKQQMAKEETSGPSTEFFNGGKKNKKNKEEDSDEEEINEKTIIQTDDGEEVNSAVLRSYQMQRLKYYYAVVECDGVGTAKNIYDNCDGTEYESTANFFDLRYIPDEMTFDDKPRDECYKLPAKYKPADFVTDALQHSKVKLTWDETPAERQRALGRNLSQKEIEENDFKAYLASSSDESDNEQEDLKAKYKALLGDVMPSKGKDGEESDVDMEITFTPALDEQKAAEEKDEEELTTIEKYKLKEKERKKQRMERMRARREEDEGEESGEKKQKAKSDKETAELELLMMDDDIMANGDASDGESQKKGGKKQPKKSRRKLKKEAVAKLEDHEVDTADPRFQSLFNDPSFAIDPTAPQFKKSKGVESIITERRKRTKNVEAPPTERKKAIKRKEPPKADDVSSLVERLKKRAKSKK